MVFHIFRHPGLVNLIAKEVSAKGKTFSGGEWLEYIKQINEDAEYKKYIKIKRLAQKETNGKLHQTSQTTTVITKKN